MFMKQTVNSYIIQCIPFHGYS